MDMALGAQLPDRLVDRDPLLALTREVMPPREALCDSCLAFDRPRRHAAIARAIWGAAILFAILNLMRALP